MPQVGVPSDNTNPLDHVDIAKDVNLQDKPIDQNPRPQAKNPSCFGSI